MCLNKHSGAVECTYTVCFQRERDHFNSLLLSNREGIRKCHMHDWHVLTRLCINPFDAPELPENRPQARLH